MLERRSSIRGEQGGQSDERWFRNLNGDGPSWPFLSHELVVEKR